MRSSAVVVAVVGAVLLGVVFYLFGGIAFATRSAKPGRSRPTVAACTVERAPMNASDAHWGGLCKTDADCVDPKRKNGRCIATGGGRMQPQLMCSYDQCFVDTDCATGQLCECGRTSKADLSAHACVPAECKTDAECGAGGFCSPSYPLCAYGGGGQHYYCHTLRDECMVDSDCKRPNKETYGPLDVKCGYSATTRRWVCMSQECPVG